MQTSRLVKGFDTTNYTTIVTVDGSYYHQSIASYCEKNVVSFDISHKFPHLGDKLEIGNFFDTEIIGLFALVSFLGHDVDNLWVLDETKSSRSVRVPEGGTVCLTHASGAYFVCTITFNPYRSPYASNINFNWVPANGGTETPFKTRSGDTLLYMWNTSTGEHAYYDVVKDLFLTQEEVEQSMQLF